VEIVVEFLVPNLVEELGRDVAGLQSRAKA
jgi:hypothetical protein